MLKVAPLQGAFGVRIEGLDLSRALQSRVVKEVVDLFYEHQVMVIPNQSLTPEQFESFCCHFGRPHPHVIQYARMKGHPTIVPLTNKTKDGAEPAQGAAHLTKYRPPLYQHLRRRSPFQTRRPRDSASRAAAKEDRIILKRRQLRQARRVGLAPPLEAKALARTTQPRSSQISPQCHSLGGLNL